MDGEQVVIFEEWYRSNYGTVLAALVVFCGGDGVRAEDSTNDAFVEAFEEWPRVSQMESSVGWVVRVAINSAKRHSRRRKRRIELLNSQRIKEATTDHQTDVDVLAAIAALPVRQRTAIVLRYVEDLSQVEVAKHMDIAVGTASATLVQARDNVRSTLDESESQ